MKKLILSAMAVCAFGFASAQEGGFRAGINVGMPMGDTSDVASLAIGAEIGYLWEVADGFKAGASVGYLTFMAKEIDTPLGKYTPDDAAFLPIVATGQYSFTDNIFAGLDLGYAMGMAPEGNDGGMLYQPKVGYQTETFEVFLGYRGISTEGTATSSIGLGFNYKF
jgi:hypothetical protein